MSNSNSNSNLHINNSSSNNNNSSSNSSNNNSNNVLRDTILFMRSCSPAYSSPSIILIYSIYSISKYYGLAKESLNWDYE